MKKFFVHNIKVSANPDREAEKFQLVLRLRETLAEQKVDGITIPKHDTEKYISVFASEEWPAALSEKYHDTPLTAALVKAIGV